MSHSTRPVSLSSLPPPKVVGFDLHIFVIGQRELVVNDDADGLLLAVVDGDFPFALRARVCL